MSRPPRDADFARFPVEDAVRLLSGMGIQVWRQALREGPPQDAGDDAEKEKPVASPSQLRPKLSGSHQRLLLKATGGEEPLPGRDRQAMSWWRRLFGLLRKKPSAGQAGTVQEYPPAQSSQRAVPYLATLRGALKSEMGQAEWREQILGKLWDELGGRPGGAMPDVLWELAGEAAFADPRFQRLAAESALRYLKHNHFLLDTLAPLRFHPNAFWLLLGVADIDAPRLQRLARRKALEDGWVGPWEAWLIRLLQRRHPDVLAKLSVPLRQRLDAAAESVPEAAAV